MDVQNKSTKKTKELKANAKQIIKTIFELNYVVGKVRQLLFFICVDSSTFLVTYATEGRWLLSDRKKNIMKKKNKLNIFFVDNYLFESIGN